MLVRKNGFTESVDPINQLYQINQISVDYQFNPITQVGINPITLVDITVGKRTCSFTLWVYCFLKFEVMCGYSRVRRVSETADARSNPYSFETLENSASVKLGKIARCN